MKFPPSTLELTLKLAAQAYGVPYTFLAALAYHESGYVADRKGKKLAAGGVAQGLFQMTPPFREHYNVRNAFDPVEASRKAAEAVAYLAGRLDYDWDNVAAAWLLGETGLAKQRASGKLSAEAQRYVDSVHANREWLQRKTWERAKTLLEEKRGDTSQTVLDLSESALQRINMGFLLLEAANKEWSPLVRVLTGWRAWYTPQKGAAAVDADMARDPYLVAWWAEYVRAYDRAPIVPGEVRPPDEIQPSLWETFKRDAGRILDEATKDALARIARRSPIEITVDDPARYDPETVPWAALLFVGAVLLLMNTKHERA